MSGAVLGGPETDGASLSGIITNTAREHNEQTFKLSFRRNFVVCKFGTVHTPHDQVCSWSNITWQLQYSEMSALNHASSVERAGEERFKNLENYCKDYSGFLCHD